MTPPTELVITLPLPPNRANGRGHWRKWHAARVSYCDWANMRYMATQRHLRTLYEDGVPRDAKLSLGFTLYLGNRMDDDNALARVKWAVDWLVASQHLMDDSPKFCRMSIPSQVITRDKTKQRLEIHIQYQEP
jgi:hypothetical protein